MHRKTRRSQLGQALVEYVIILAVFAVVLLAAIPSFQDSVGNAYIESETKVTETEPPTDLPTPPPIGDVTVEYTVRYVANGGVNAPAMQTKQKDVDLELSSDIPTYTGHEFVGWSVSLSRANGHIIDYSPGEMYTNNADLILYASWRTISIDYEIRYHVNAPAGATAYFNGKPSPIRQEKQPDIPVSIIPDVPVCDGYTFLGWNESSVASTATKHAGDTFSDNRDADFYAIWTPVQYNVVYHANGGSGTPPATEQYSTGDTVNIANATLMMQNHQFAGWSTDSESLLVDNPIGSTMQMPAHDVDLYAVYMPTEFPYNGTDGTDGTLQSFTAPVDGTYQIKLWGAKGGSSCNNGEYNAVRPSGGYTVVKVKLTRGQTIYFAVGGHGADNDFSRSKTAAAANPGGWNGGGNGYTDGALDEGGNFSSVTREGSGGGGGATSAYTSSVGDGQLKNYSAKRSKILGVAGGGAGANYTGSDGYGGGTSGGNGAFGGTKTSGYAFGTGESATGARRIG